MGEVCTIPQHKQGWKFTGAMKATQAKAESWKNILGDDSLPTRRWLLYTAHILQGKPSLRYNIHGRVDRRYGESGKRFSGTSSFCHVRPMSGRFHGGMKPSQRTVHPR